MNSIFFTPCTSTAFAYTYAYASTSTSTSTSTSIYTFEGGAPSPAHATPWTLQYQYPHTMVPATHCPGVYKLYSIQTRGRSALTFLARRSSLDAKPPIPCQNLIVG
ncbi:uncharacterized protein UV8b_05530 [Ustilaginoidea virens]|uniref:Uncharacterized protein n=1 Tax=Ustilaginoidea virens TaxID=1159556 RepID=A0A8E5MIQ9_USTVR|nr:uncharacterized protein UV8b_05530 [Ustilaginoidea virens]QUC21287.1 hypothetical protein UV8b_05530 [Ustilaginoidea virens]